MAQWRPMSYKTESVITNLGDGINSGTPALSLKDSEMTYLREMDSKDYPALSVRPGRTVQNFKQSTTIWGYDSILNIYHVIVNGNTMQYFLHNSTGGTGAVTITTALSSTGSNYGNFAELGTGTYDWVVYMNLANKLVYGVANIGDDSTAVAISDTNCPAARVLTAFKGRIYAALYSTLHFSALNAPTDWTTANDAGKIDITTAVGSLTALVEYGGNLIIFADNSMHILYGSGPSDYQVYDIEGRVGCISHRAITKCRGNLYWIARDGVYEYSGTRPVKISEPIKTYFDSISIPGIVATDNVIGQFAAASAEDRYVYFSVAVNSSTTNNQIWKYDTLLKAWFIEDATFWHLAEVANDIMGVGYGGYIVKARNSTAGVDTLTTDGETPISWSFITKPFTEGFAGRDKVLSELNIVASISTASTAFSVGYSTNIENNGSTYFTDLFSTNAGSSNAQMRRIQVPVTQLQNVPWYRLRFAGSGPATVNFLEKNVRVKRR